MVKRISATQAKHRFGELLEEVLSSGCVHIVKHGRVVAVIQRASEVPVDRIPPGFVAAGRRELEPEEVAAGEGHFVAPSIARAARMVRRG